MSPPVKAMLVIVIAVALSAGVTLYNRANAGKELVPWRTDAAAALESARAAGKPTLLYFTASWCGPCQWMKQNTFTDPGVAAALEGYVPVKIDVDQPSDLPIKYQVRAIPRMIVLNPDGSVQRDETGGMGPDEVVAWLKR